MSDCYRCGAQIRFVRMESGKPMPCNPIPDDKGNVAALRRGDGQYVDGYAVSRNRPPQAGYTLFRPHFADCSKPKKAAAEPPPALF